MVVQIDRQMIKIAEVFHDGHIMDAPEVRRIKDDAIVDIHRTDGTDANAENGAKAHHAIDEPPRHGQQLFRGALADILRFKGEDVQIEIAQHHGNARFADEAGR